jgi:RNA polymerase sigma-70 factor (ECF subfamily)
MMSKTGRNSLASLEEDNVKEFDNIFRSYYSNVNSFLKDVLKSDDDAERLAQEVFIILWRERKTIASELDISDCLFEITYKLLISYFRERVKKG